MAHDFRCLIPAEAGIGQAVPQCRRGRVQLLRGLVRQRAALKLGGVQPGDLLIELRPDCLVASVEPAFGRTRTAGGKTGLPRLTTARDDLRPGAADRGPPDALACAADLGAGRAA